MRALATLRNRIRTSTTGLFSHVAYPLRNTLHYPGDPGVCGPGSVSWPILGDTAAFVGGIRALLMQSAHPEVVAGVADHSIFQEDPLGRLSRTSAYVTATTFGALPEVKAAIAVVRDAHADVVGRSHRGRPYSASGPALSAWVHNVLTDSFLAAYSAYGPRSLVSGEDDRFVLEQAEIGRMLHSKPVPVDARSLRSWIDEHPDLDPSPGMRSTVEFLEDPPLAPFQKIGYRLLYAGAVAIVPVRIRHILGLRRVPGARTACLAAITFLRWAMGSSPSWRLALIRTGNPVPSGLFLPPLPQNVGPVPREPGYRNDCA